MQKASETLIGSWQQWLTAEEQQRAARFRFAQHRRVYILTRALEKTVLSHCTGMPHEQLAVQRDRWGKPRLAPCHGKLYFNISHTDDWVVIAVAQAGEIGVDVECSRRRVDIAGVARAFFHPDEYQALQQLDESRRSEYFFSLWTLKEAWIKAIGKGLAQSLRTAKFDLTTATRIMVSGEHTEHWQFRLLRLDASHVLALCMPLAVQHMELRYIIPPSDQSPLELPLLRWS